MDQKDRFSLEIIFSQNLQKMIEENNSYIEFTRESFKIKKIYSKLKQRKKN